MTSHPIVENCGHWWLCTGKWRVLHAIPGDLISREAMRESIDENEPLTARAACGIRRRWEMPGIGSRLGRRRCTTCCRTLGIKPGHGTPANGNDRPGWP